MNSAFCALKRQSLTGFAILGTFLIAGCDSTTERDNRPVGSYTATVLSSTENGVTTNHLANGSTISLVLLPDGATTGVMHIAAAETEPAFDAPLDGTWSIRGLIVMLRHNADTFLRDMPLTFDEQTLVGDRTVAGTRVQVTLTRLVPFD